MSYYHIVKRKAFTLIELLVCIAVIAVLAAILIPTISKVRASAEASKCSTLLRQLATASLAFSNDNNGLIVPWRYYPRADASLTYWEESLSEYLDVSRSRSKNDIPSESPLLCPTEEPNIHGEMAYYEAGYHSRYSINLHIAWNQPGNPSGAKHSTFNKSRYTQLADPALTYLFMDLFGNGGGGFWMGPLLTYPHNGTVNVAYVDGHVEAISQEGMHSYLNDPNHVFWRGNR